MYMALQRLNSPHKIKGWYLQGHARLQQIKSSFSPYTNCQKNICSSEAENSRTGEGSGGGGWKRVMVPLVLSLRYSGNWGGRGKLEVSQQRPIRAALPPSLHMRGSWDMYLQYPSLCHTHTTLPEASFTRHMMPGPCGFCASSSGRTDVYFASVCTGGSVQIWRRRGRFTQLNSVQSIRDLFTLPASSIWQMEPRF